MSLNPKDPIAQVNSGNEIGTAPNELFLVHCQTSEFFGDVVLNAFLSVFVQHVITFIVHKIPHWVQIVPDEIFRIVPLCTCCTNVIGIANERFFLDLRFPADRTPRYVQRGQILFERQDLLFRHDVPVRRDGDDQVLVPSWIRDDLCICLKVLQPCLSGLDVISLPVVDILYCAFELFLVVAVQHVVKSFRFNPEGIIRFSDCKHQVVCSIDRRNGIQIILGP